MLHLAVQTRSDIPKLFLFWLLLLDLDACQTRKCKPVETEITKQLIVFVFDTPKSSSGKQPACCTLLCNRRKAGTTHLSIDCSSFVTQRHKLLWEFKAQAVPIMSTRFCVGISKSCSPCDSTFPGIFHLHLVDKSWSSAPSCSTLITQQNMFHLRFIGGVSHTLSDRLCIVFRWCHLLCLECATI